MSTGIIVGIVFGVLGTVLLGLGLGFFFALKYFKKQMNQNPPINEQQIRAMYAQMGRTPSEQQVRQIMSSFKKQAKK